MSEVVKENKVEKTKKSLLKFFREVRTELKKVIWPSRQQLINNTLTVLMCCLLVGAIIWIFDMGLAKLLGLFIKQ